MNTINIKSFAREARLLLLDSVLQRLKYWGFNEDGSTTVAVETTTGGYIFRGQPFTDITVPAKWQKLKTKLTSQQAVQDVVEEVAYTWFNRLMAIKILEVNGYIPEQLAYTDGSRTPLIVQRAKRGEHQLTRPADQQLLLELLREDKDEEAFALLITHLCHSNRLLHDIFGRIDDYTEILFPQNSLKIDGLLDVINSDAIPVPDFKEVELIGWLYQFYISDKKDAVFKGFKKNIKARAEDIPAATQIFTPKWIVSYMVENTVGKIYLDYELDSTLRDQMKYLVENESESAVSSSAVENTSLINDLTQLTLIDPAAGSGHILVTGFELLFKMYREAGYTATQAVEHILTHNLYGLDIDDRAMQLARFAVLLKAAQYNAAILERPIMPHIYSFPVDTLGNWFTHTYYSKSQSNWYDLLGMQLAAPVTIEWQEIKKSKTVAKKVTFKKGDVLNEQMVDLLQRHCNDAIAVDHAQELELFWGEAPRPWDYSEFFYALLLLRQGKNLGSAIQLNISPEVYTHIKTTYEHWQARAQKNQLNLEETSIFNLLKPFIQVFLVLASQYKAVVANPPYMGQKSMNTALKTYVNTTYPVSKSDLFAVFMEACLKLNVSNGLMGMINQHSWMFLSSYEKLRHHLLCRASIENMLHLGPRTFEELSGEVVQSTAFVLNKVAVSSHDVIENTGTYYRLVDYRNNDEKERQFLKRNNVHPNIPQINFAKIPGSPIAYWVKPWAVKSFSQAKSFDTFASPSKGMMPGSAFILFNWEVDKTNISNSKNAEESAEDERKWYRYFKGGSYRKWKGNQQHVVLFYHNGEILKNNNYGERNPQHYFKRQINWSKISSGKFAARDGILGGLYDDAACQCPVNDNYDFEYMLAYLNSCVAEKLLSILHNTLNYSPGEIAKIPTLYEPSDNTSSLANSCINISKKDWNSRETSWDFKQSPLLNESTSFNEAYQIWKDNATQDFFTLHSNEEELNRIFIDIYRLQEELTPQVALKDITILQEELNSKDLEAIEPVFREQGAAAITLPINKSEVISQFLSYAIGVFLGRYRLDKPGLNIAHPNPTAQELAPYQVTSSCQFERSREHTITIDDDGIVPLMGDNAAFPDDALVRTKELLLAIWGEQSLTENINFLQDALGMDLHKWLTEKFWSYHTSMYKKKPIYWLFASNLKKPQNAAFKVLVYMHRMDKYTVQQIQRNYLYPHQEHIKNEIAKLEQDEDSLNKEQQKQLEQWRHWQLECRDYNEVLKTLANQQIEIDLDDGVTVNYAKFEGAVAVI